MMKCSKGGLSISKHVTGQLARIGVFRVTNVHYSTTVEYPRSPAAPSSSIAWGELAFGLTPAKYMYVNEASINQEFSLGKGQILPYGPLALYPSASVLSYGQGIFEGIKAFRTSKNRVVVFRPKENAKRINNGAETFLMSKIPESVFIDALDRIVISNSEFVPPENQGALYLRPILFGSGPSLGVAPSPSYTFAIYVSPVGNYFKSAKVAPIDLVVSADTHRSAPKGSGATKAIGNYAPCFRAQTNAKKEGFSEVLFVDSVQEKYIEEVGAANVFCVTPDKVLHTPSLRGTILPGITRQSIIQLAKEKGYKVNEDRISLDTFCSSVEAFASGTGASITPIGSVTVKGTKYNIGEGVGKITQEMTKAILDIQYERVPDTHGWLHDPWQSFKFA
eukprot:TRINITY_DN91_c0_g1_i2.p1 TRINITY_DN91_c0_g1~~TRINITY_DN91_c0_g1_i2.p1  ORF type:complete len:392 (+),score=80.21 TRINITY_DN91_c0_g1_i2:868-2043(+)